MTNAYVTSVIGRELCEPDVLRLSFARPEGYSFDAGQWFRLTVLTADGEETKTFSHATPPHTSDIEMATRLSGSTFKHALAKLRVGDEVRIAGPGGRLRLPEDARSLVFLTGGVGVTPVRSLLLDAANRDMRFEDALVLYGNRDDTCDLYLEELASLDRWGVRVVPVYETAPPAWQGETGFITAETVRRNTRLASEATFVVSGPPAMVAAMGSVLDELGVRSERRIVERFGVQTPTP